MKRDGAARAWLRAEARAARGGTRALVVLGLCAAAAGIVAAWALSQLVAPVLEGEAALAPLPLAGVFLFAATARALCAVLTEARAAQASARARRRLRTAALLQAFARGPHAVGAAGTALATLTEGIDALDSFFARWLPAATLAWAAPLLVIGAAALADPWAALIMAAGVAIVPFGMAVAGIGAAAASRQQFAAMARLQSRFLDRMQGIGTLVLLGRTEEEAGRLGEAARELSARTMRVLRVAFLSSAVMDAAAATVLVVLAVRAGMAWRAGGLQVPSAIFTLVLVAELFAPLRAFAAAYQDRVAAQTAAGALGRDVPGASAAEAAAVRTVAARGVAIAFEDVHFSWDPSRPPALDGLSFRVPANETAVLVGPSGAGKSTAIELLLGFIRPDKGRITINGAPIDSLTPQALARMTAWIGQRPVLFAGSIRENIRFGRTDASPEEVDAAAVAAGLDGVAAELPLGLDTVIGEGGYGLSGGQAQRIAIARAVVRQAPLLILDEPTAHLDPMTEADVLDRLRRLASGRTVLMASHSMAAIALAGRRIPLAAGRAATAQGAA